MDTVATALAAISPEILARISHLDRSGEISKGQFIAGGAYGDIYKGLCTIPDRGAVAVAIKCVRFHLREDIKMLFEREIYVWSRLRHHNILPLLGYAFDAGTRFPMLASQWMENGSAWKYVNDHADADVIHIIYGIVDGLAYLHSKGIVHSDIKSDNIVISDSGDPLICDFGCSRMFNASMSLGKPSLGLKGTSRYLAYELVSGQLQSSPLLGQPSESHADVSPYTTQTDVWAFGMTTYELLTLQRPYRGLTDVQAIAAIMKQKLPSFEHHTLRVGGHQVENLIKLCKSCWSFDPSIRPSMVDVSSKRKKRKVEEGLEEAVEEKDSPNTPETPTNGTNMPPPLLVPPQPYASHHHLHPGQPIFAQGMSYMSTGPGQPGYYFPFTPNIIIPYISGTYIGHPQKAKPTDTFGHETNPKGSHKQGALPSSGSAIPASDRNGRRTTVRLESKEARSKITGKEKQQKGKEEEAQRKGREVARQREQYEARRSKTIPQPTEGVSRQLSSHRREGPPLSGTDSHIVQVPIAFLPNEPSSETIKRRSGVTTNQNSPEVVDKIVRTLLDKLTMEKFESISDQIIAWANKSENEKDGRTLIQVIRLVVEKAIDGTARSEMYAQLCRKMKERISPNVQDGTSLNAEGKPVSGSLLFHKYLWNRCKEELRRTWPDKETTAAAVKTQGQIVKNTNEKGGGVPTYSDEYYAGQKVKRRGPGLMKFLCELFKLQLLAERIMHECVKKLLSNVENPEGEIESLCVLLTTVGWALDTSEARGHMDVYFTRMKELSRSSNVSPHLQSMLHDVIELRERKWVPRIAATATHWQAKKMAPQAMSRGGSRRGQDRNDGNWNMFKMHQANEALNGPPVASTSSRAGGTASHKIVGFDPTRNSPIESAPPQRPKPNLLPRSEHLPETSQDSPDEDRMDVD